MSSASSALSQGRYAFDHDQALGQSNVFDASNAVEDPLLPLAMPLTFPLPLAAFDNVFIPPQSAAVSRPLPQAVAVTPGQFRTGLPPVAATPGQFRTGHSLQLKPTDSPSDAKPLASLHSVHTLLPQENMFHQATGTLQTADGLTLPAMQHVLVTGADGQMIPAYLIPVAALGAAQPLPRHPNSFFPHHRPSSSSSSSHPPRGDAYDHHRHEPHHHNQNSNSNFHNHHQKHSGNLVASAASPHPERLKPFRPSQPLGLDGFTISSNPHTHAPLHHAHSHHRQRPPYATRSVVSEGGGGGGFKAVESSDQRQVPTSMYVLKPPSPEKISQFGRSSFSYQVFDQPQASPAPQPQPPKYRTIVQLRPVQPSGVSGVVSNLLPGLRPSRDLAGEQTVLNAILSQEL
ncbi:uncharacterized protein LOC120356717 [Nilaparvata lugens]|uniref:uncharacterized protein LOC120356717 n=1 Tax=Nilaparvata lugens TaxID=108931 RepID=UPI00193D7174|nr:uncharacterized protein LOC120356717 [Nilaparvata lugens]